ncbi:Oxygen-dependent choline dehydrogenase [Trichinella spiralis]|uniref:Oxygen-dependent choline dehydrogenase n=1 Tax=Trichinella spiralis TaxID=6334 RepID=A0ABR3KV80_TRISP
MFSFFALTNQNHRQNAQASYNLLARAQSNFSCCSRLPALCINAPAISPQRGREASSSGSKIHTLDRFAFYNSLTVIWQEC